MKYIQSQQSINDGRLPNSNPFVELKNFQKMIDSTRWRVTVPVITTMSDTEIKLRGYYIDNIKNPTTDPVQDTVTIYTYLDRILEIWEEGHPVRFDRETVQLLISYIKEYLTLWVNLIESSVINRNYPYDYIIKLSEFYESILPYECSGRPQVQKETSVLDELIFEEEQDTSPDNFDFSGYFKTKSVMA